LATLPIEGLLAVVKGVTFIRADINTGTAFEAELIVEKDFRVETDAFRVVTPPAFQGATFKKYGGPYAWTIMN
jgi:hypothetical protein